ncbi:hypothetical protein AAHA92_17489 [Salvia divinorum]|uniref:Uncharacterized protein n=1 Tax=Salvia divinorum TaxID=28513 RepID=A0ABD1GYZ1_SALDI
MWLPTRRRRRHYPRCEDSRWTSALRRGMNLGLPEDGNTSNQPRGCSGECSAPINTSLSRKLASPPVSPRFFSKPPRVRCCSAALSRRCHVKDVAICPWIEEGLRFYLCWGLNLNLACCKYGGEMVKGCLFSSSLSQTGMGEIVYIFVGILLGLIV